MAEYEIKGLDELCKAFEEAYKVYPDITIKTMRSAGRVLRKMTVEETDAKGVGVRTGNLRKGYRFSIPTRGAGSHGLDVTGVFRGETRKNPHMHLIEHGHRYPGRGPAKSGKKFSKNRKLSEQSHAGKEGIGRNGAHMVENAVDRFEPQYVETADECMKRILKRAKL